LFVGMSLRHVPNSEFDTILNRLLQPPQFIASSRNREGSCPLHFACGAPEEMVPISALQRLLEAYPAGASRVNSRSRLPLHVHCSRKRASVSAAQLLVEAYPEGLRSLDQFTEESWTPLHYACAKPNIELIEFLGRADSFAMRLRSRNGETPLHVLCRQRPMEEHLNALQLLLDSVPEVACWKDVKSSFTPLHILCRYKLVSVPIVQAFVRSCPQAAAVVDANNYLPLHHACEMGADAEVIQCLIEAFAHGTKAQTRKHDTALSLACAANASVETVKILLAHNPKATSMPNDYGFIPLHCVSRAYQPSTEITRLLIEANPETVTVLTNGDETAIHLASSNSRTSVAVLQMLTNAQESLPLATQKSAEKKKLLSSTGNTPLHYACFRGAGAEQIEALALAHPEWISVKNNAGYAPLQILCKSGRIDDNLITLFARIGGPGIFQTVDQLGNSPLHSAIREETEVEAILALLQAYPRALHMKTAYNDMPIHLACFRRMHPKVVREVALASCKGVDQNSTLLGRSISPLLTENTAGQTPISIAMEEFEKSFAGRSCYHTRLNSSQDRAFNVLVTLCKIIHSEAQLDNSNSQSLLEACVALHRKNIRLDPAFIRRAISIAPEEARQADENGNYPLHIEAAIPVEKMPLLSGRSCHCCRNEDCHSRIGVLQALLDIYPDAAKHRSNAGDFPLGLMVQNGRPWDRTFATVLSNHPQAFHWIQGITAPLVPHIISRVSRGCGYDTLFTLIQTRPDFLSTEKHEEARPSRRRTDK